MHEDGRRRVVIESVEPEIDCGRFPIKRTAGEKVVVEADVFTDGHDALACILLYRRESDPGWTEVPMEPLVDDRWRGEFVVSDLGGYRYTLQAWVDRFQSWRRELEKKVRAGQESSVDLPVGARLVEEAVRRASGADARALEQYATALRRNGRGNLPDGVQRALEPGLADLMSSYPDRRFAAGYGKELAVVVDRERARFSAWYELFPRSCSGTPGLHSSFKECEQRLPYVAGMGFDVLYLPPVHPIGRSYRKGKNNSPTAGPSDPGSPWAIGAEEGGHKAVHPDLGTLEEFRRFVEKAREQGLEIALDLAFQTSPDHPYAREHPEWFRRRPDGTIQYAENPPKKYEDIYPFDFETDRWRELWQELKSVVLFWIEQGVQIFRIDNPHTKPFPFWEWLIAEVKREHPQAIFLSEAFTRPRVMYRLAKLGFTQSYSYFAWRNSKEELIGYFTELTQTEVREYFRPHLWPNTPDILTEYLQHGGRPAFMARLLLAATLGAGYGIYGPAFELQENQAREPGSEEYLDSEKYQIGDWEIDRPDSLRDFIARVNRIRRQNPALHGDWSLRFHPVDNDQILCYSKSTEDLSNVIVVVVNLDPYHTQSGWVELPLEPLSLEPDRPYQMHDLLSDAYYLWHGSRNYVEVNPHVVPAHIFRFRYRVRTERDFEYFM
ncbi:MAG: alpha-1,4-glucan--maltose-1-phosphate maltosyltransferase [Chloroflexi bacterium]|nr:alpha-1,4-glucan--maltose-1-phosphate maltosyltransferase [Chloroflexota bacterium]